MRVPNNSVVVVADGRKLLFLRNEGDEAILNLTVEHHETKANPATRDQGTDAPGAGTSSTQTRRDSYEQTDFHQLEEDRFAADVAELLKKKALGNAYDSLFVIAPPRTLGELRKHYHKEVEARIKGELPKDLTGHQIPDIEKILTEAE